MSLIDRSKVSDQIGFTLNGAPVQPGGNKTPEDTKQPRIIPIPKPVHPRPRGNPNIINLRIE